MRQATITVAIIIIGALTAWAQTTAFSYQGRLSASGSPANGSFDFEFRLYDAVSDGTQLGPVESRNGVAVTDGIFSVTLDFNGVFPGASRFLEIRVRQNGGGSFTTLLPRQPVSSSPYSIQTINSQMLGGISASQYVQTSDPRLTDARDPLPGSPNYIQNTTLTQAASNFNVAGNGTAGSLTANTTLSVAGSAKPAPAPAGQGRLYFDNLTNKLRVSENGDPFVDLVGATGVGGSGTPQSIPLWTAGTTLGTSLITQSPGQINLPVAVRFAPNPAGDQVAVGTPNGELGFSLSGPSGRSDMRFNGTLKMVNGPNTGPPPATNGIAITQTGNVGVGTETPTQRLEVFGGMRTFFNNSTQIISETTGGTNAWARFYMRTPSQSWFIGTSQNFNGNQFHLFDETGGQFRMTVQPSGGAIAFPSGNVGIGTGSPNTRLTLNGGTSWTSAGWTASMNMQNASALGWEANASGQRFGIGQSGGGLYFFRTTSAFGSSGSPANYDLQITDNGNLAQSEVRNGLPKAMLYVDPFLPAAQYIVRCYNGVSGASTGNCGFTVTRINSGIYDIAFGFQVDNRFVSLTTARGCCVGWTGSVTTPLPNVMRIYIHDSRNDLIDDSEFYLIVY